MVGMMSGTWGASGQCQQDYCATVPPKLPADDFYKICSVLGCESCERSISPAEINCVAHVDRAGPGWIMNSTWTTSDQNQISTVDGAITQDSVNISGVSLGPGAYFPFHGVWAGPRYLLPDASAGSKDSHWDGGWSHGVREPRSHPVTDGHSA